MGLRPFRYSGISPMLSTNKRKWLAGLVLTSIVGANVIAYIHAYKFTHFTNPTKARTGDPETLSLASRIGILFTGIDNPHPEPKVIPHTDYETLWLHTPKGQKLECWYIKSTQARGTAILFHGYAGEKSSLLGRAATLSELGFNTFLVDFTGSGGSDGNCTSVGYTEAAEVKACFDYVQNMKEQHIVLFGTSMGAAAVLKAMDDYPLNPAGLILECPFGSLYKTVSARFSILGVPAFPMAGLLCFWGGIQNGYWAFGHNPSDYAKAVTCPTLLLHGKLDERVTLDETQTIYKNLGGRKTLKVYTDAGHDVFTPVNRENWSRDVISFVTGL